MTAVGIFHRVTIEAPDGAAALELEQRLAHLGPTSVSHAGAWTVDLPAVADPEGIDAVVELWLRDVGATSSAVLVDGAGHVVAARRRHRATNAAFAG